MPVVNVMLSTYNGEKFLEPQVESILSQTDVEVNLFVRDDGSTDDTLTKLKGFSSDRLHLNEGSNVGWRRSFFELLFNVPIKDGEYYAFADQDDVWLPNKLSSAVQAINQKQGPTLYHSNMALVNEQLEFVGNKYPLDFSPSKNFPQYLFDGIGTGSTIVFNSEFLKLVRRYQPQLELSHDAYLMALANLLATVVYDPQPHLQYRRHAGNATGFGKTAVVKKPSLSDRFRRYKRTNNHPYSDRSTALLDGYRQELTSKQRKTLASIATYRSHVGTKISLLVNPMIRASQLEKTFIIKYRILCNSL